MYFSPLLSRGQIFNLNCVKLTTHSFYFHYFSCVPTHNFTQGNVTFACRLWEWGRKSTNMTQHSVISLPVMVVVVHGHNSHDPVLLHVSSNYVFIFIVSTERLMLQTVYLKYVFSSYTYSNPKATPKTKGALCSFWEVMLIRREKIFIDQMNKLNEQTDLKGQHKKDTIISYWFALYICGGPRHLSGFK